jgi:hypothetical protein
MTTNRRRRKMLSNDEMREHKRAYTPSQILDYFTIDLHSFFSLFFVPFFFSFIERINPRDNYKQQRMEKKKKGSERERKKNFFFFVCRTMSE